MSLGFALMLIGIWATGWQDNQVLEPLAVPTEGMLARSKEPIVPLPLHISEDPAKVALGERLFHDVRLSGQNNMSCATCHQLGRGGDDGLSQAVTATGQRLRRNTPMIFNVAFNMAYNWDGGVHTLAAHAEHVLLSPALMHATWPELLAELQQVASYRAAFAAIYPGHLTSDHVLDALVTYERSLVTPNSRFDRYLRNDPEALSAVERRGYEIFKSYGCAACHQGINVGGSMFQKFGIFQEVPAPQEPNRPVDLGRFLITRVARDREVFRVPSLRNVAVTAPYFHDGRTSRLEDAVAIMARVQLGRTLSWDDIHAIVRFLHTLTGEYRGRSLSVAPAKG